MMESVKFGADSRECKRLKQYTQEKRKSGSKDLENNESEIKRIKRGGGHYQSYYMTHQ